jgi:hypothetical protein
MMDEEVINVLKLTVLKGELDSLPAVIIFIYFLN